MSATASVTAEQLVRALGRNKASLPAEIGTFLMFEGCESMLESGPRELENLSFVRISEHGNVTLTGVTCDDETAARSLHRSLSQLLLAAGPALPPALSRLAEQGPRGGKFSLRSLHDELEAALVPLNRTASRRVLSRFAREAAQPLLEGEDVDAALNSLIGGKAAPANDGQDVLPAPPPMPAALELPERSETERKEDSLDGLDLGGEESHYLEASRPSRSSHDDLHAVRASVRPSFAPQVTVPAKRRDEPRERELRSLRSLANDLHDEEPRSGSSAGKLFIGVALVALAIIGVTVALSYRRERAETAAVQPTLELAQEPVAAKRAGDLSVHVMLPNAQVLRYVGTAPITVPNLPVGFAHEFVATATGYKPSRVLVPADAQWETTAEGPRYETALQLSPLGDGKPMRDADLELGPSRLDAQSSAAPLKLGAVRVVATPHGARVYQLVGFSPDVRVTDLPLEAPQEFLIYREGYLPKKLSVQESDFAAKDGRLSATYGVQLEKRTQ